MTYSHQLVLFSIFVFFSYLVISQPLPPITVSGGCDEITLTRPSYAGSPAGYYWQTSPNGTSYLHPGLTYLITTPGTHTIYLRATYQGQWGTYGSKTVTVYPTFNPGIVSSNTSKTCYGGSMTLSSTGISGGTGSYGYQWQELIYNQGWRNISGATSNTLSNISNTGKEYRLRVTSGSCGTKYSNALKVPTYPPSFSGAFTAGSINGTKTICYNSSAGTLGNAASAEWGNEPASSINYQWQVSSNNSSWSNISGVTGSTYSPGNLTATRWYRRRALTVACGISAYTSSVKVTVVSVPTPVLQNISPGCGQATITLEDPNPSTGIGYNVWWQDTADGTFQSQTGSNAGLSRTVSSNGIYYARIYQFHDGCWGPALAINVNEVQSDDLVPGVISSDVSKTCFSAPMTLTSTGASGGTGDYDYQWEYRNPGVFGWQAINWSNK